MSHVIESDGTIKLTQGDSAELKFYDIDHTKDYLFSFGVFDSNRNFIGEITKRTENKRTLTLPISTEFTDKLTVFKSYKFQTYYYGVKLSDPETGAEDTCTIDNKEYGSLNRLIVYPKQSEGL